MTDLALDFETEVIDGPLPPKPVGVALSAQAAGQDNGAYFAWGHPSANNSSRSSAQRVLAGYLAKYGDVWCFNAGFDIPVYAAHLNRPPIAWGRVRDAQILAFLGDPFASQRSLKNFAERLGATHSARDDLYAWIRTNVVEARRLGEAKLGAFISQAPGDLVGRYAVDDVTDVWRLRYAWGDEWEGTTSFDREHAILPVLDDMRRRGVPIARRRLARDAATWERWLVEVETWLGKRLGIRDLKPRTVIAACEARGLVSEWILTNRTADGGGGTPSLAAEALAQLVVDGKFTDRAFVAVWGYRSYFAWMLRTFVRPWLAQERDFVHPTWNGVRQEGGGAVTGRLSSTPNVQNLPKRLPEFALPRGLAGPLPNLREYVEAPAGMTFVGIDISQQELRILGHYVPSIGDWYREQPRLDLHTRVQQLIRDVAHVELKRDVVKIVNFCTIYGGGAAAISRQGGVPYDEASRFKKLHAQSLPGISRWDWEMHKGGAGSSYFTAGGRRYVTQPGKEYRDKNYAIQGSAADQLKRLLPLAHGVVRSVGGWIPLTAHDEILTVVPTSAARAVRRELTSLVASTGVGGSNEMFDVPMLGETYQGRRWVK